MPNADASNPDESHDMSQPDGGADVRPTRPTRPDPLRRPERRFPIRLNCPHCRNPIAIVDDSEADEVVCPSCGSSFQLDVNRTVSWRPENLPTLGRFELLAAVGHGAFGTVYRARDVELHRTVAVKVPRSGTFATAQDEDRFYSTPQIASDALMARIRADSTVSEPVRVKALEFARQRPQEK